MQRKIYIKNTEKERSIRIECAQGSLYGVWEENGCLDTVAWRYMIDELMNDKSFSKLLVIEQDD